MVKRIKTEQSEHDLVIEKSAATYRKVGGSADINPSSEKNYDIKGYYPDVIGKRANGVIVIEEIETESTVTEAECENQWKPYSKLGYEFILVVPRNQVGLAQRFIRKAQIDATIQTYFISGNAVSFFDSVGNPIT